MCYSGHFIGHLKDGGLLNGIRMYDLNHTYLNHLNHSMNHRMYDLWFDFKSITLIL